uniref:G_PROTEIN_RECEP_F1_2 domain-containing protein n=1 Tax=Caenorhabditis tropicalis TaxID=1561998 RepID=A0A1I7V2E4_9PELO
MNYTYSDFQAISDSNSTISRWISVANFISLISEAITKYEFAFACMGVIVNIFHLTILTRKSLRSNSINVIMIGIGICDLFNMSFEVYSNLRVMTYPDPDCWPPSTYTTQIIEVWLSAIKDDLRRLTPWLGVLMSSIRYLIIKMSMKPKFKMLSEPKFSIIAMLIALVLSTLWSAFYFARLTLIELDPWKPANYCTGFPPGYTEPQYALAIDTEFLSDALLMVQVFLITDGTLKIIPTTLFPILAFLLIRELNGAKSHRQKLAKKDEKADHTTSLVILMTVTFMTAEGPLGIIYVVQGFVTHITGLLNITSELINIFAIFVAINATTHCLICLTVSSQYRKTVKGMFLCQNCNRKKTSTIVVAAKVSVTSTSTVRQ